MKFETLLAIILTTDFLARSEDAKIGFSIESDSSIFDTNAGDHGQTILGPEEVKSSGYIYGISSCFLNYNEVYFQLWRPISEEYMPFKRECRLLYSKKIQPVTTKCRSDIYFEECLKVEPGDMVGLYSALVPWGVSTYSVSHQPTIYVYNGYQQLLEENKIPEEGVDYLLDLLYDEKIQLKYLSFVAHVSLENPTQRLGQNVQFDTEVVSACDEPNTETTYWEGNEMTTDSYDWWSSAVSFILHQVGKYGKVTGFRAFASESGKQVFFQLWKPADLKGYSFELVSEHRFTVSTTGINEFTIDVDSQVTVEADYRFGILIPEETSSDYPTPIASVQGSNSILAYDFAKTTNNVRPSVGQTFNFGLINYPIYYSVGVAVKHERLPYSTSINCQTNLDFPTNSTTIDDPTELPTKGPNLEGSETTTISTITIETPDQSSKYVNTEESETSTMVIETTYPPTKDQNQEGSDTTSSSTTTIETTDKPETNTIFANLDNGLFMGICATVAVLICSLVAVIVCLCLRSRRKADNLNKTDSQKYIYSDTREESFYDELNYAEMFPGSDMPLPYEGLQSDRKVNEYATMNDQRESYLEPVSVSYLTVIPDSTNGIPPKLQSHKTVRGDHDYLDLSDEGMGGKN